jgi:hypothetical protein
MELADTPSPQNPMCTEWDFLPFAEKLMIAAKEQECAGARIWRETGQEVRPDQVSAK